MKISLKAATLAAATICGGAGLALATPSIGLTFTNVFGIIDKDVHNFVQVALPPGTNEENSWQVHFGTQGASNFIHQDLTIAPGGSTGWHTHPGVLLVSVAEGSIEWFDKRCGKKVYNTGASLTENDRLHYVRNVGSVNARLMITFVVPKGVDRRIDQAAPACAAEAGIT